MSENSVSNRSATALAPDSFVYIIDDDGDVLASAAFLLQSLGIPNRTFSGAESFLHSADSLEPGCILCDFNMPGMSGLKLQQKLLSQAIEWPFILMSGQGDIPVAVEAIKKGAVEYLQKPFTDDQLLAVLHSGFRSLKSAGPTDNLAIRGALKGDRVVPHYQPKVDLRTGRPNGFEALLRWDGADSRADTANAIRDAFADPALGEKLSRRMLECILLDVAGWLKSDIPFGRISFNASGRDLENPNYAEEVLQQLARAGVRPDSIQIEVLETVAFDPHTHVRRTLERLSNANISIALDDFGTGYASLTHLRALPVDTIKIDRSFVSTLGEKSSASIVRAMIGLAKGLDKEVIAEGVETKEQVAFLKQNGCDTAQGYYFGQAIPGEDVPSTFAREWPAL
ncbi:MAG: EAL domain-containing response regulator [Sphingosinicella sp.]|nr:EAL domain-containing response regulator [Sphingosinicella sp.]